jgi:hypothetical protein
LLGIVAEKLRKQKQVVSSADLIAVEIMAQSLATLRGQPRVWRRDLIDGIIGALVKEEMAYNFKNDFLETLYNIFRGEERGRLAEGTSLPLLVIQIQELLSSYELEPRDQKRDVVLDLSKPADLEKSHILHQIRVLELPGYKRTGGVDFTTQYDADRLTEVWQIQWSPEFNAACIEASIYGATLAEAALTKLYEQAQFLQQPNAAIASKLMLNATLMGMFSKTQDLYKRLSELIFQDGNFFTVSQALGRLIYLYRFDEVLGTAQNADIGDLLQTSFHRGLWLLESLGVITGQDKELLQGIKALLETFERCAAILSTESSDFTDVFVRIGQDNSQTPLVRGASSGVLWVMQSADAERVLQEMRYFAQPNQLGDFLTGLFYLARDKITRSPEFIQAIDKILVGYSDDGFLVSLPSLRLAFSFFDPREKHQMAFQLFKDAEGNATQTLNLKIDVQHMTAILAFEATLFKDIHHHTITPLEMKNTGESS